MARPSKEYKSFEKLTDELLSVPRATIEKRIADHKERAAQNPKKRRRRTVAVRPMQGG